MFGPTVTVMTIIYIKIYFLKWLKNCRDEPQAEGSDLKMANSNCGYILNKKVWYIKDKIYVKNVYIHITSVYFQ